MYMLICAIETLNIIKNEWTCSNFVLYNFVALSSTNFKCARVIFGNLRRFPSPGQAFMSFFPGIPVSRFYFLYAVSYPQNFIHFFTEGFPFLPYKAHCRKPLMKLRPPLNREQAKKAPFILKSTLYRITHDWWIPEDFLRAMKICSMSVSTL